MSNKIVILADKNGIFLSASGGELKDVEESTLPVTGKRFFGVQFTGGFHIDKNQFRIISNAVHNKNHIIAGVSLVEGQNLILRPCNMVSYSMFSNDMLIYFSIAGNVTKDYDLDFGGINLDGEDEDVAQVCPACDGKGKYVGFTRIEDPCQTCQGLGHI